MKVFSLFDLKAESFNIPFFSDNNDTAIRSFVKLMQTDSSVRQFAADYQLFELGEFDQEKGIVACTPVEVCTGLDARKIMARLEDSHVDG